MSFDGFARARKDQLAELLRLRLGHALWVGVDERERVFAKDRDPARERKQAFQFIERALQSRVAAVFEVRRAQICLGVQLCEAFDPLDEGPDSFRREACVNTPQPTGPWASASMSRLLSPAGIAFGEVGAEECLSLPASGCARARSSGVRSAESFFAGLDARPGGLGFRPRGSFL